MLCKFRCYVPKGASRKAQKGTPPLPCDEDASHNAVVQTDELLSLCTDVEVQTNEICLLSVDAEIQTDVYMASRVDVAVQTDEQPLFTLATTTAEVQTNNLTVEEGSILDDSPNNLAPPDVQVDCLQICEGNNDEKFLPLIKKHKGVFMNAKGIDYLCKYFTYTY